MVLNVAILLDVEDVAWVMSLELVVALIIPRSWLEAKEVFFCKGVDPAEVFFLHRPFASFFLRALLGLE